MKTVGMVASILFGMLANIALADEVRPGVLRTPDSRFENLPGYDFEPHYLDIRGYRVHYLDDGPVDGEVILLLHGEPSWSYLYRKMIPILNAAGYRTIVPDLIGFGRSDKPISMDVHTYLFHVDAMTELVEQLDLQDATFFGQDWGGLIGLRVVAENEERFARVVVANTGLSAPTNSETPTSGAFMQWKATNQAMVDSGNIETGDLIARVAQDPSLKDAYDAPFPDPTYKAGPLIMPQRVPVSIAYPGAVANAAAWEVFRKWEKPFLTAFSDSDPISAGGYRVFQQNIPGAQGQDHVTIEGAGHFLQEQKGEELAEVIVRFMQANPLPPKTAMLTADEIPIAHTPVGYWQTMPPPVLSGCTEPLVAGAIDMRGFWKVVEAKENGTATEKMLGGTQRIEQCGNRVVITGGGVTHDMRADGTYENGVNDIGEPSTQGRPISVAASFENGVHILRPKGAPLTVERELVDGDLIWRYGPVMTLRLERIEDPSS